MKIWEKTACEMRPKLEEVLRCIVAVCYIDFGSLIEVNANLSRYS